MQICTPDATVWRVSLITNYRASEGAAPPPPQQRPIKVLILHLTIFEDCCWCCCFAAVIRLHQLPRFGPDSKQKGKRLHCAPC